MRDIISSGKSLYKIRPYSLKLETDPDISFLMILLAAVHDGSQSHNLQRITHSEANLRQKNSNHNDIASYLASCMEIAHKTVKKESIMKTQNQQNSQLNILREKIEGISTAMMTTLHNEKLVSRPMESLEMDDKANIWFITSLDSPKIDEILKHPFVNLAYSDPSDNRYVSISGQIEVVEDRKKLDELWNGMLKAWFPEGKDSANVKLLRVVPLSAEYWDSDKNAMVRFFEMTKAILKGKQYVEGENAKIDSIH